MTIDEARTAFVESVSASGSSSVRTVQAYAADLAQFLAYVGPHGRLEQLGARSIETWLASLRDAGYAPASRRRKLASVRCLLTYCVRRKFIANNPLQGLRLRVQVPTALPRTLAMTEARTLLKYARSLTSGQPRARDDSLALRDAAIVEVLLATGLRVGELVALSTRDVDEADRTLTVIGKGQRQRLAFITDDAAWMSFARYYHQRRSTPSPLASLFLNHRRNPLTEQGVAYVIRKAARSAGIVRRVTPHMLRHTAATLLLRSGADLRVVQEFLGHASVVTTQRYTHLSREHLRESLSRHHHFRLLAG